MLSGPVELLFLLFLIAACTCSVVIVYHVVSFSHIYTPDIILLLLYIGRSSSILCNVLVSKNL